MFQGAESQSASRILLKVAHLLSCFFRTLFQLFLSFLGLFDLKQMRTKGCWHEASPDEFGLCCWTESALLTVVLQQFLTHTISIQEWLMLWGWHHSQQLLNFLPLGILFVLQRFFSLLAFLACLLKNQCDRTKLQRRRTHHGLGSQCPKKKNRKLCKPDDLSWQHCKKMQKMNKVCPSPSPAKPAYLRSCEALSVSKHLRPKSHQWKLTWNIFKTSKSHFFMFHPFLWALSGHKDT